MNYVKRKSYVFKQSCEFDIQYLVVAETMATHLAMYNYQYVYGFIFMLNRFIAIYRINQQHNH